MKRFDKVMGLNLRMYHDVYWEVHDCIDQRAFSILANTRDGTNPWNLEAQRRLWHKIVAGCAAYL